MSDWRLPYRSMDASGAPNTATAVGWDWIGAIAEVERVREPAELHIESPRLGSDGHAIALYRGTQLLAVATIFRDPMNHAVLVRWLAPGYEVPASGACNCQLWPTHCSNDCPLHGLSDAEVG